MILFLVSTVAIVSNLLWEAEIKQDQSKIRNLAAEENQIDPRRRRDASLLKLTNTNVTLSLTFVEGTTSSVQFDYCAVAPCPKYENTYSWRDKTLCIPTNQCGPAKNRYGQLLSYYGCLCEKWEWVALNEDSEGSESDPRPGLKDRLKMIQAPSSYHMCREGNCNPLRLTLTDPKLTDSGLYVLQAQSTSDGPGNQGLLRIVVKPIKNIVVAREQPPTDISVSEPWGTETEFADTNLWLQWVQYSTSKMRGTNCIVCSEARSVATPVPTRFQPLSPEFSCMLTLFTEKVLPLHHTCQERHWDYPPVEYTTPPQFKKAEGPFDCIVSNITQGPYLGRIPGANCSSTNNASDFHFKSVLDQTTARADLWWWCGGRTLYPILPSNWTGTCALVQLIMPFYILPVNEATYQALVSPGTHANRRSKRDTNSPGGSFDDRVYIDAIGVPRGVPDEFKARNQIAAGFESTFLWWVTINKNVDWVNYIYYNQQRFVNFTRDAISGLHAQLAKTSLMTLQNRMALDMILAREGGVCRMFGLACCTFIPNNTAPDGSVTRALAGLTALSVELAENSGIQEPFTGWLESIFAKWKGVFLSVFISFCFALAGLVLCGCCCIPCIRGLIMKLIETTLTKTSIQGNQLRVCDDEELELLMATV